MRLLLPRTWAGPFPFRCRHFYPMSSKKVKRNLRTAQRSRWPTPARPASVPLEFGACGACRGSRADEGHGIGLGKNVCQPDVGLLLSEMSRRPQPIMAEI